VKTWLLEFAEIEYDQIDAVIVRASTREEALELAAKQYGNHWLRGWAGKPNKKFLADMPPFWPTVTELDTSSPEPAVLFARKTEG